MKFNQALNNFSAGEWSPKMYARTDLEAYFKAAKKMRNAIPQVQGGAFKRPGTMWQALNTVLTTLVDSSNPAIAHTYTGTAHSMLGAATKVRIFPFVLSNGKRYVLFVTNGKPAGYSDSWFLYEPTSGPLTGSVHPVYKYLNSNFSPSNIDTMEVHQAGDTLFFVNAGDPIRFMQFKSTLVDFPYTYSNVFALFNYHDFYQGTPWLCYPYKAVNSLGVGGNITATGTFTSTGTVTLTSTVPVFTTSMTPANNRNGQGKFFRFTTGGFTGVAEIQTVASGTSATAYVQSDLPGTTPTTYGTAAGTSWDMAAWGSDDGWPATAAPFQGRLYFGRTALKPDTLWGSKIGNVFWMQEMPFAQDGTFATYTADNSRAWTATPNSAEVSNILALSSSKILVAHTDRSELALYGSNTALGPLDVNIESSTSFGSERVKPTRVNNFLTFVQRGGRKLRDVIFSFDQAQYKSTDLMQAADHLTVGDPIAEMISAEIGSSVLLCRTQNGRLLTCTLDRDANMAAWAKHSLGGIGRPQSDASDTVYDGTPQIISMCALPGVVGYTQITPQQNVDSVFFLVRRKINGTERITLERMIPMYEDQALPFTKLSNVPVYMDFSFYFIKSAAGQAKEQRYFMTLPAGGTYPVGDTFSVLADNIYVGELQLTDDGAGGYYFNLPFAADVVLAGYKYAMQVIPMPIEQGAQNGSPMGSTKRVTDIYMKFFNTIGCRYGTSREMHTIPFRKDTVGMDEPTPMFTGEKDLKFPAGYEKNYEIVIHSDFPYPCNVNAVAIQGMTYD